MLLIPYSMTIVSNAHTNLHIQLLLHLPCSVPWVWHCLYMINGYSHRCSMQGMFSMDTSCCYMFRNSSSLCQHVRHAKWRLYFNWSGIP